MNSFDSEKPTKDTPLFPLYSIHIHYFAEVLPRLFCRGVFKVAVALVFTTVLQIFTRGGHEVGTRGKDEVLLQPDGSILSGGTVHGTCFITPATSLPLD